MSEPKMMIDLTDDKVAAKAGEALCELLMLSQRDGRVPLAIGDKTPAGLARAVKAVLEQDFSPVTPPEED